MSDEENVPNRAEDDLEVQVPDPVPGSQPEHEVEEVAPLNPDEGQAPTGQQDDGSEDDPFEEEVG
jgi:hypothetical protein